ncbi:hypothetical protein [Cryobacterium soli]|uniref:hypothetical protein n=1 Tax=Cryobacterium soli TaxID=2220095 RepID=UPI0013C486EE|nr:hypothetical protein [Cryobacterium soli]
MGLSRIVVTGMLAFLLCGCASAPGGELAASETPPPPTRAAPAPSDPVPTVPPQTTQSSADAPLTCADLVGQADVDEALGSASVASDIATAQPYLAPADFAPTAAGGIRCVWLADGSVDRSPILLGPPGVPWLDVEVLPGAAAQWTPYIGGDDLDGGESLPFAGFVGAHSCGDPGCTATAAINDAWVSIIVHVPSQAGGFAGIASTSEGVFAKLTPAATAVFSSIANASAAQISWPSSPGRPINPVVDICSSFLQKTDLSMALGVPGGAEYQTHVEGPSDRAPFRLRVAALERTHFVTCTADAGDNARLTFTLMLDNAALVNDMAEHLAPPGALHLEPLELQVNDETAVSNCVDGIPDCDLWFTLGSDAIYVASTSTDSRAVADSILAQAR